MALVSAMNLDYWSMAESKLVWIRGPEPAAASDLGIYKAPNGLKSMIPAGKKVVGDSAYKDPTCSIWNSFDTKEVASFKKRARARHENFNGRLKRFKILSERFRHNHTKHGIVFEAICVICQYDMENGSPLFSV